MMAIEELLETEVAMLAADRACELAETRLADLEALLEQMRADRDYWRDQAQLLEKVHVDRNYWREQTRPVFPWWKRIITTEWSSQRSVLGSLS
jgi:hypothetical protein